MTDTPDLPPPTPAGLPPVPDASASLPPSTPASRPRIWQAALLFVAFGLLAGGSCAAFLSGNIGVRGDLRYFRSLQNDDPNGVDLSLGDFRFWRGTIGVTFKF